MISSKYSIAMAAILFAAAFAGVAVIADDSAADDSPAAGAVTYKVTYVYGDNVRVVTSSSAKVTLLSFEEAFSTDAPEGYEFDKWKVGSSLYAALGTIEVTGDITVEPTFKAAVPIVKLVYGDKVLEIPAESVPAASSEHPTTINDISKAPFTISKDDIENFAELIGAKTVKSEDKITGFEMDGYEFIKFFMIGDAKETTVSFDKLSANAIYKATTPTTGGESDSSTSTGSGPAFVWKLQSVEVNTYEAVFEPVYDITFIVEGAQVGKAQSNAVSEGKVADSGLPVAPVKENYIFIGWFDAEGNKVIGYSVDKKEYTFVAGKDFRFTADTTLYAHFIPLTYTVTFVYGEDKAVFTTETVKYGEKAIEPKGLPEGYKGWDFDFAEAILADTEIVAIPADPVTIYTVTFEIDGKAPVTQRSDSMVLPDTAIDGKVFQGWVVKGESQYVDPMKYDIQSDITFVAVYKTADPPAGPGFFETNEGKCVAVIIGVGIIALFYAIYTNMFGMKDFLTSFKVQRVKKE